MKLKKLFKEIEIHVIEESSRIYIDIEDLSKILYDLCFTKTKLDIHTLRVFKRLIDSIQKTYKVLKMSDDYDINSVDSVVELSRKKVKALIDKSYQLSQKDRDITTSSMDELEEYLAIEEESLPLSKEETKEIITMTIKEAITPMMDAFQAPNEEVESKPKKKETPSKKETHKKKNLPIKELNEDDLDKLLEDLE